ncbi:MAG: s23 ribosomal protein [Parcubacteria group bacterium Gr01-1014_33]|nr:MAG: s23 ribosomal protein [Parcubacteria group bacterium Gr01-1014_33]
MEKILIKTYRDLIVWQKSIELVIAIYDLTSHFPKTEIYGLTAQMRRASVSIPSNIAEGRRRGSKRDFRHFLLTAFGSGAELETQIDIVKRLPFGQSLDYTKIDTLLNEVMRMLNRFIFALQPTT